MTTWVRALRMVVAAFLVATLLPAVATPAIAQSAGATESIGSVIYLVRHAEKAAENPDDPVLTPVGEERARELARVLESAGITRVYSTETIRTLETARPTATAAGVEIQRYAPQDRAAMAAFVETLLGTPGRTLVVGHSNTTPQLVQALGGDPVSVMEDHHYDRLYVVVIGPDGNVTSTLLHFGAPSAGGGE